MNWPKPLGGFGRLGANVRAILAAAKASDIQSIIVETIPLGSNAPPSAEITNPLTGKLIRIKVPKGGSGFEHPFQLIDASNEDDGTQVRVRYGTVNGEVPSGMSAGDDPPYIISVSGTGVIWLIVTTDDDGNVTSVSIDSGSTVPDDTDTSFHEEIGSFEVDGDSVIVADNLTGSQSFTRCRNWFSNPATYSADWSAV